MKSWLCTCTRRLQLKNILSAYTRFIVLIRQSESEHIKLFVSNMLFVRLKGRAIKGSES